jgi:glycosyltransferase involved in cell wall biosynthesis
MHEKLGDQSTDGEALAPTPDTGEKSSAPRSRRVTRTKASGRTNDTSTTKSVRAAQPGEASIPQIAPPVRKRVSTTTPRKSSRQVKSMQTENIAPSVTPEMAEGGRRTRRGGISPENTVFVSISFEGPDVYSSAGGLGTRVTEFTESLASLGYETHLIFVGDPGKPSNEERVDGKLHLKRWGQWISKYYPNGVYDGEEHKLYDFNDSLPPAVYNEIVLPAISAGKMVAVIGEDWHTAEVICRISDLLHWHNQRQRCVLMWNCNSLMSLYRINWGRLNYCSTITTVSRYMKHRLWNYGVNPLAIPNGIPSRYLDPVDEHNTDQLRAIMQYNNPDRFFLFKIGRFDPDKRWLMAVEAAARLKHSNHPVSMAIRGGIEPHGAEVLGRAHQLGLAIKDIEARRPTLEECLQLMRDAGEADIYNLRFFLPTEFVRTCYAAADATLANSGHEPFGLVGLEVMAAGGVAFTGSTGEDYAVSFENAVALETEDPEEIVGYLLHMQQHPDEREKIRIAGKRTAAEFTWEEVLDNLAGKLVYLARKQGIVLE